MKIDIIANRAKQLLTEDDYIQEFSHTVLHGKCIVFDSLIFYLIVFDQPAVEDSEPSKPAKMEKSKSSQSETPTEEKSAFQKFKKSQKKIDLDSKATESDKLSEDPMAFLNDVLGDLRQK